MKFKSQVYTQASGSIGGTTYSRNKGGMYTRSRAVPTDPGTSRQSVMRAAMGSLVSRWISTLTEVQRQAWRTYAQNVTVTDRLGDQIQISGQNHFIRSNAPRVQANLSLVDDAPTIFDTGEPITGLDLVNNPGTYDVVGMDGTTAMSTTLLLATPASDDGDILIYLGPSVSLGRNFNKGPYQLAAIEAVASSGVSVNWQTADGSELNDSWPVIGQKRGFRARVAYDDGRLSEEFSVFDVIVDDPGV